jgi:hypothetical protein
MGICLWYSSCRLQLSAILTVCSQLQLVASAIHHCAVCFRSTYICVRQIKTIDENFYKNSVMKWFPPYKQFTAWRINSTAMGLLIDKKQKHKCWVIACILPARPLHLNPHNPSPECVWGTAYDSSPPNRRPNKITGYSEGNCNYS